MNVSDVVERSAVTERAYLRWLQRGCPHGSPDYDWFEAEQELMREHAARAEAAVAPSVPVTPVASSEPVAAPAKPVAKRSRGRRGSIESSAAPASGNGASSRRRGPASSTKPAASSKRRAAG